MIKTLFIAPYSGLAEAAKKVSIPTDFNVDIKVGDLEGGVEIARLAEEEGYDLIISRGGTASMIQEEVSIPVVHIDINGYDMLRVFTFISGIDSKIAIVGFENITRGAATVCNILDYDIELITIKSRFEVKDRLIQLKQQGISVVIGDVITFQEAEKVGLRGILITSGKESIMNAFEVAQRHYKLFQSVNNRANYFHNIVKALPYPIILVNKDYEIMDRNNRFMKKFNNDEIVTSSTIRKLIKSVIINKEVQWTEIEDNKNFYEIQLFLADEKESIVGIIIQSSISLDGKIKSFKIQSESIHMPIIGESEKVIRLRDNLKCYADSKDPLFIVGEDGTGKNTIAQSIHFEKFGQKYPFVSLEGKHVTFSELRELEAILKKMQKGTLVINNVEEIPIENQLLLVDFFNKIPLSIKIISISNKPYKPLVIEGKIDTKFMEKISKLVLHISPLRERKVDIKPFIGYFLSEFHAENGNETLGIKTEAVDYLMQFDWLGNFRQLKQVVRELSVMSTSYYIELSHVKELMNDMETSYKDVENVLPIKGTLEEMEQQIIKRVMEEENHNQTKVAKRLGINRSTLWRKLNQDN
ncbi:sigma-54-dependent Fis family transcriptional regulator [Oceanobacillus bengalensis]|nr:sigma-54-dependent transcriptional regulator [Oceanobacillus bengalensis]